MKTGKNISLKLFKELKTTYGTVDSTNFKSLFVNIQTWVQPRYNSSEWRSIIGKTHRKIRHIVNDEVKKFDFKNRFIVDLDLRGSGILLNKNSFMSVEIILYPENNLVFKSDDTREAVTSIIKKIHSEVFRDNKNFTFQKSKKSQISNV